MLGTSKHKSVLYNDQQTALSDILLSRGDDDQAWQLYALNCRPSGLFEDACETEMFFSHLGGEGKWLLGTAALIRGATGQLIGAIESWQDLTEHKRLQSQLIQTQKMEAIGTLTGGIAHDFSNVLTAIAAHTELVRRRQSKGADIDDSLQHIMKACNHGKDLIRRLMLFSRPSEQTLLPTRIDAIINEAIDLARSTLPSSIQIHRNIHSAAIVAVDATQLKQVVLNLCTNAAQAMEERTGELTICLTHATKRDLNALVLNQDHDAVDFIKLSVKDTGHGIPADILQRVFEPFFTTKTQDEGSGMGLAISHSIIKSFGGYICVDSRPGQGAEFFVFLPVVQIGPETLYAEDNNCGGLGSTCSTGSTDA